MISHPMRLDSSGAVVTVDDYSPRAAAELAGHVVSCHLGERSLAPLYGLPEPVLGQVSGEQVAAQVAVCEPEVMVTSVRLVDAGESRVRIQVDVEWSPV